MNVGELCKSVLFSDEDVKYLRLSHDVVKDEVEAILDVWYRNSTKRI